MGFRKTKMCDRSIFMIIHGLNFLKNIESAKRKRKSSSVSFSDYISEEGVEETKPANDVAKASSIGTLLAIQEVASDIKQIEQNKQLAEQDIASLEDYQKALLTSNAEQLQNNLKKLQESLGRNRARSSDVELEETLDAIEVRAAVEAAKREKI